MVLDSRFFFPHEIICLVFSLICVQTFAVNCYLEGCDDNVILYFIPGILSQFAVYITDVTNLSCLTVYDIVVKRLSLSLN